MRRSHEGWGWIPALLALAAPGVFDSGAAEPAKTQASPGLQPQGRKFERDVAQFLERYRRFLGCCAASLDAIPEVKALDDQASSLLAQAQTGVASELKKIRGFTIHEFVAPVERVWDDLRAIKKRLEQIQKQQDKLEEQDLDFLPSGPSGGSCRTSWRRFRGNLMRPAGLAARPPAWRSA